VCLLGLYALVGRAFRGRAAALGYALPFGFYLGVTLVVPLLRGASARTEFLPHAGVVLAFAAAAALALRLQKSRRPAASSAPSQTAPSPS